MEQISLETVLTNPIQDFSNSWRHDILQNYHSTDVLNWKYQNHAFLEKIDERICYVYVW
jgi:hypothetical protein